MSKANEIDMLHGPLLGKILRFAMPFAASSIMQQLFNSIDLAVVGRFASSSALAAVGANTFLINLLINLFVGISIGANVILANYIGQHDEKGIARSVSTTAVLSLISGFVLLLVGITISRPILELMGTPTDILPDAVLYLRIFFLGTPFLMIYNFGASILRSKGDTRRPLYILLVGGVINTLLNLLFVIGFHRGVEGVAVATAISNAFCATVMVILLRREEGPFQLHIKRMHIYGNELRRILQIGVPAGIQGMVFSFSNVFVQSAINGYGAAAIAGASVSQLFDSYCYFLIGAFCGAAVTFTGQCYGAGDKERCKRIFRICLAGACTACLTANLLIFSQQDVLLSLFTTDPEVIYYAKIRIGTVLIFQSIASFYEVPASAMRGLGHSLLPALLTIFGTCVLRLTWIFFVCPILPGYDNLMLVYPISWVLTSLLVSGAYIHTSKKAWAFLQSKSEVL